ncbi:hypothetical protein BKH46_02550 [Helicobacter sp. 12S02634-8]|nr:hypothetical protein BKH46_02550 [Helicobacter sp. 12S02634-8]
MSYPASVLLAASQQLADSKSSMEIHIRESPPAWDKRFKNGLEVSPLQSQKTQIQLEIIFNMQ